MKEELTLRETIDQMAVMAKTKRIDISFNELLDMYQSYPPELEISPLFQRVFVWGEAQQSQFIESLLLELPIPPIYVIEQGEEGRYLLIDGLQRLSTYFHFRGVLTNDHQKIFPGDHLALEGCDIVPLLNGRAWKDLDTSLQIRLKRAFVSLQIIRKESLPDLKYHMFKRLNSGGSAISPQQIRNAYVRMLEHGDKIMDFAHNLSEDESFSSTCRYVLTEQQRDDQADEGLILRFLAFKNDRSSYTHDIDPFIDAFVEKVARGPGKSHEAFNYAAQELEFKKTFKILEMSTGEQSFTFPNRTRTELTAGFSVYHFEAVTLGLQKYLSNLDPFNAAQMWSLKSALRTVRLSEPFRLVSAGGGRNSKGVLRRRIEIIESAVADIVSE